MNLIVMLIIIFSIALLMTMTGRGGGNFYVLALVLSGISMHESASAGQFILFVSSISATLVFGRGRHIEWRLVLFIGSLTALSAFFGGVILTVFHRKNHEVSFFVFSADCRFFNDEACYRKRDHWQKKGRVLEPEIRR